MAKVAGRLGAISRNTTGSTYVNVGQVLELGDYGSARDLIDASAHGDDWKDYVLGQKDGEEVTLRVAFDPADAQQVALLTDYDASTVKKFHITHPSFATRGIEISAIVTRYIERTPIDGVYEAEATLKIVNPGMTTYVIP